MALHVPLLNLLRAAVNFARKKNPGHPIRALSLGYPDVLASRPQLIEIFGSLPEEAFVLRPDSVRVLRWHGATGLLPHVYEADAFLRGLGIELECLDVRSWRGGEIIADLNEPLPASMNQAYDLVINAGTAEHCFNVPQALKNVAEVMAVDGVLVHSSPMNRFNHGYWNFNPNIFPDFFGGNGFKVHLLQGMTGSLKSGYRLFDVPTDARFDNAPEDSVLLSVCQRTEIRPITWPTQHKYR